MKRKVISLLLTGVMTMSLLAGCGGSTETTTSESSAGTEAAESTAAAESTESAETTDSADNGDVVEIDFYMSSTPFNDQERVMEKANAIIEEEIGAHLNIFPLADYTTMQLMIDTGDEWDMCFTSNWLGDYYGNAQKGAFADLTELLPELAPETYNRIPASLWEGMKVDGKIYGMVNYQIFGSSKRLGLRFREDIAEEVGFDWQSVKGMDIFDALNKIETEYLAPAMEAHPDMIGWEAQAGSNLFTQAQAAQFFNSEYVGDSVVGSIGWINYDDPTTVFNQYASEDFMEYCKIMRRWYENGYIPADAATVTDTSPDRQAGRYLFEVALGWPDDIDFPLDKAMSMVTDINAAPAVEVSLTDLVMPVAAGPTAAVAVNSNSANIEKCVELMELLNTNDELYKLICYGEEGVDYSYDEEGNVVYTDGGYFINYNDYQIAQSYDDEGFDRVPMAQNDRGKQSEEMYAVIYEGDQTAEASPLSGFVFDPSNVQTEIANVTAVVNEMLLPITTGSVDPEETMPEFLDRLETAGASKNKKKKQAQLDAWLASK